MIRKRRGIKQRVIVVLEGIKAFSENKGVAPLWKAMYDVIRPEDEVIVLTLLPKDSPSLISSHHSHTTFSCVKNHRNNELCGGHSYFEFLHREISQRVEAYAKIFKPFYLSCENYGVKFQVKIAAGTRPKDIVMKEANSARATWIVMDRCFANDLSLQLRTKRDCNVVSVSDDGKAIFHNYLLGNDKPARSISTEEKSKLKSLKLKDESITLSEKSHANSSSPPSSPQCFLYSCLGCSNKEEGDPNKSKPQSQTQTTLLLGETDFVQGPPVHLKREVIEEIRPDFSKRMFFEGSENVKMCEGFLPANDSRYLVKIIRGDSSGSILKAEIKAALHMHHKNILRLSGYFLSENSTVLVFPSTGRGSLDQNLGGNNELTFKEKLKIARGIARGIRYMHEECPRGPIVHGQLLLTNIFLGSDLRPQISGFGRATWLSLKQTWPFYKERCSIQDHLDHEMMSQVKSDVRSFGVLLMRMFCRSSMPKDDDSLIKWARPLLLERAFHELIDEDTKDLEMHEMFRVMCTAFECTITNPEAQPSMSEVISYLKGERLCSMQPSPQ